MKKLEAIKILKAEIEWCEKNLDNNSKSVDYKTGFIKGLKQAILLLKQINN